MAAVRSPRPLGAGPAPGVVHPQRRVRVLLLGILVVLSLFAAQLVRMQGLDAAGVSATALGERMETKVLPAARGTITDLDGKPLAQSIERKRITADPTLVATYEVRKDGEVIEKGLKPAARRIAEITGVDEADVLSRLEKPSSEQYTVLAPDVSPQAWQDLRKEGIVGVYAEDLLQREYDLGRAAAPVLGWVGAGEVPAGGLETVYNDLLTGTPGRATYEAGPRGEIITTGLYEEDPAVPGGDVRTTLDSDVQWYAYDAVRARVRETGAVSGYAVVMEARTGRLLALSSYPSFDPAKAPKTSAELRNAAVEDVFEPGSTSKLITAAAALEEGIVEPDTPVEVPVRLYRGGSSFKDSHEHPVEHLTFAGVLATSSNMGTILYGEKLKDQQLYDWIRRFGIGTPTGLGLPGESGGLLPAVKDWSATTRYTLMFGQGLSSTMLQQVGVFQTIANDGVRVPPSIVAGTTDEDGRYVEKKAPEATRVVSEETAKQLTEIMQQVPSTSGTAPLAAVPGYHVAGKTSTASRIDPEKGVYDGVTTGFIGYAPADDPKYVVGVVIQRPTKVGDLGGVVAAPVFSDIMRFTLQKYGVRPATTEPVKVETEYDPEDQAPGEPQGTTLGEIAIKDERTDQ